MNLISTPSPPLGTLLRQFRQEHHLSVKQSAVRLGLALDRLRALEQDASVPTSDELTRLAIGLGQMPHRILRAIQQSALALLWDTLHPPVLTEAVSARSVVLGPDVAIEAVSLLPVSLRIALADAMMLPRLDEGALQQAWTALLADTPARQRITLEAAVAQLQLEGDDLDEPLFPC